MKKLMLVLSAGLFLFSSCGSNTGTTDTAVTTDESNKSELLAAGDIDPVCGEPRQDNWTDYSVVGTDTLWFCCNHDKAAFDKNPDKYLQK